MSPAKESDCDNKKNEYLLGEDLILEIQIQYNMHRPLVKNGSLILVPTNKNDLVSVIRGKPNYDFIKNQNQSYLKKFTNTVRIGGIWNMEIIVKNEIIIEVNSFNLK